jgi:hypothetical protein
MHKYATENTITSPIPWADRENMHGESVQFDEIETPVLIKRVLRDQYTALIKLCYKSLDSTGQDGLT